MEHDGCYYIEKHGSVGTEKWGSSLDGVYEGGLPEQVTCELFPA